MKPKLLIVDDDEEIRTQMKWALSEDYEILPAQDRPSALEVFRTERPAAALLDLGLPPRPGDTEEGFALLSALLTTDKSLKAIVITGQNEKDHALRAIGAGAYDFLCKPVDMQELKFLLKRCFYVAQLEKEHREMQQVLSGGTFEGMLGTSPKMQDVFAAIRTPACRGRRRTDPRIRRTCGLAACAARCSCARAPRAARV